MKAVRGVLADDELTKAEREEVLRKTFDDYAGRTGRDGLKDIASIPCDSRRAGSDQSRHPSRPCDGHP